MRLGVLVFLVGCAPLPRPGPLARAANDAMPVVPAGEYVAGSTPAERQQAYADYAESSGNDAARTGRWFAAEEARHTASLPAFRLDRTHVTMAMYAEFLRATGGDGPTITEAAWRRQGYVQPYHEVTRFLWRGQAPPAGRDDHPVLLVTFAEAEAYCAWRGARLPTAAELEKAMRGRDGRVYPWGDVWDASKLNTAVHDQRDVEPVAGYSSGPYGHHDLAGLAFHWTATPWPLDARRQTLKGSAWDDYAGVGRGAAGHGRPRTIRHALISFRCAR